MMDPGTSTSTSTSAADPSSAPPALPAASRWAAAVLQRYQHLLDKSVPHVSRRWVATLAVACAYLLRVYFVQGFYIVTYGLGIYMLNVLIGFLSPQVDPELQDLTDGGGPSLPTRGSDEFRPFVRRLPEFKCWLNITWAFVIAFSMTFFSMFDVPVFWPVLLFYWVMLFTLTMRKQIMLMVKYRYVPFSFGKRRYNGKRASSTDSASLPSD